MLEHLEQLPTDPILGLMAHVSRGYRFAQDRLGVGVYRDDRGETPMLAAVRQAEQAVLGRQKTKSYVAAAGNAGFNQAMTQLAAGRAASGPCCPVVCAPSRVRVVAARLRLGAELLRAASPETVVHVSDPTWANHYPLLKGSGLDAPAAIRITTPATGAVRFEAMLASVDRLPPRSRRPAARVLSQPDRRGSQRIAVARAAGAVQAA